MKERITPQNITKLTYRQIFVFGSNLAGIHGGGAARFAYDNRWAKWGKGYGIEWSDNFKKQEMTGSFAIPTKGLDIEEIPLTWIRYYIEHFIEYAKKFPELTYLVTEIGCGIAGYTPEQIAPMFRKAMKLENVYLPQRFWNVLNKKK